MLGMLAGGLAALGAFVVWQLRARERMLPSRLLRIREVRWRAR
ncbi:hypothetical protein [Amycolatopsis thermophila]|uniref:Uncharacterized protein n=1 Tax=Amycolatopsis thermophila TaxID=206084 RepID=A0ABU0F7A7_9PSEU|nr:hypothetical protein [Amycolatopsis thermophila]MDQ0383001.1 hypothetical protein [Amycolatopsis thermophila]